MKTPPLKKLKPNFETILTNTYKYRFLNRPQYQSLHNHKYRHRVIIWLNKLTEEKYLKRYYSAKFAGQPAFYSLNIKARKYFTQQNIKGINISLLDRVYREHTYSLKFKKHYMFLADIYLSLVKLTNSAQAKLIFNTKIELTGMKYLILPEPDAYFSIEDTKGIIKRYFLDIFDELTPNKKLYKRMRQYFTYYKEEYWQDHTGHPSPEIIMVCPDNTSKNFFDRNIKKMAKEKDLYITFHLSTWDEIKHQGISNQVLHRVILEE